MLFPGRDPVPDASGPWMSKQGVTEESVLFLFPRVTMSDTASTLHSASLPLY